MKTTEIIKAVIVSAALVVVTSARADLNAAKIGKMEIASINKMVIETVGDNYFLRVGLSFHNGNPESVKLRKGVFATRLFGKHWETGAKDPEVVSLDIGEGKLAELELPGTASKTAKGVTTAEVLISLGSRGGATVDKVIALWNIIGNADNQISLFLNGSAELGQELSNGWVFEQGKTYEVELTFEPKVQRRVLFQ